MKQIIGAALLLAGTCIGAGMLALPVSTAPLGLLGAVVVLILASVFMAYTGYLVVEVSQWFQQETSYISMARTVLGKPGQYLAWVSFLLLLYALMVAYMTGGGALVAALAHSYGMPMVSWQSYLPWMAVFAVIVYRGARSSDWVNRVLMIGLIVSYVALATSIVPHLQQPALTAPIKWHYIIAALPVLIASFGYHIVLPSMCHYLGHQKRPIVLMVAIGSAVPLIVYLLWVVLIFASVPLQGDPGLMTLLDSGQPVDLLTNVLAQITHNNWVVYAAKCFAFFAIASSFVGVSLGLFDLLADGIKARSIPSHRLGVALLTFVPPFIFACWYPQGFLYALGYAGVFVAVLHGILPALMVWRGRYSQKQQGDYRAPGHKILLSLVFAISILIIIAQLVVNLGMV